MDAERESEQANTRERETESKGESETERRRGGETEKQRKEKRIMTISNFGYLIQHFFVVSTHPL